MPAYDYRCITCDATFEVIRPAGDTRSPACPQCGGSSKRVFTPVGVVFKGSGFHNTDYRPAPQAESEKAAPATSCESAGSKSACSNCPAASD